MKKILARFGIKIKEVNEEKATLDAVFSTANEDRHGDIVKQNWDLKNFKKNPVIINSHKYGDATEVIGKAVKIKVVDGKLEGKIQFAVSENPKAKIIFDLYKNGFLSAFSVGFMPKEFDDKGTIMKSELLEVSCVSVPANAEALAKMKAKGIEVEKLEEKDFEGENEEEEEDETEEEEEKEEDEKKDLKNNKFLQTMPKKKEFENWEDCNEYIRCKVRDIAQFETGTLKKVTIVETFPKIVAIVGILTGDKNRKESIQMLFFPKNEGWTLDDAKKWLSRAQFEVLFGKDGKEKEPAKPGSGEIEVEEEDSLNAGKSVKSKIYDAIKEENNKKTTALNKIIKAIELVGEYSKVETRPSEDAKAKNRSLINRAVRKLIKLKEK